jgi:hypothetical protein
LSILSYSCFVSAAAAAAAKKLSSLAVLAFAWCFMLPVPGFAAYDTPQTPSRVEEDDKKKEDREKTNTWFGDSFDFRFIGSKSPNFLVNASTRGAKTLGDALVNASTLLGDRLERGMVQASKIHGDELARGMVQASKIHGDELARGMVQASKIHGDRLERGITILAMGIVLASSLGVLAARWTEVGNLLATCSKIIFANKIMLAVTKTMVAMILSVACLQVAVAILNRGSAALKQLWSSLSSSWWHKGTQSEKETK